MLIGVALARLSFMLSYGSVLRKRSTCARSRAQAMNAQACSLACDDSFAPCGTRAVRDEAS